MTDTNKILSFYNHTQQELSAIIMPADLSGRSPSGAFDKSIRKIHSRLYIHRDSQSLVRNVALYFITAQMVN